MSDIVILHRDTGRHPGQRRSYAQLSLGASWGQWQDEALGYFEDPALLETAGLDGVRKLLTLHVRKDRFVDRRIGRLRRGSTMLASSSGEEVQMPMSDEELAARLEVFESKRPKILPPTEEELELKEEIAQILLKPAPTDADWARHRALHRLETFLYIERVNRSLRLERER